MSSTTVFKGSFGEKPSSRVLRPPGGGSSNIFGHVDESPQPVKATEPTKATEPPKATEHPKAIDPPKESAPQTSDVVKQTTPQVTSPETKESAKEASKASGAKEQQQVPQQPQPAVSSRFRNSGFNPITGQPYPDAKVQPSADEKKQTSITVKHPPGGASSGLW